MHHAFVIVLIKKSLHISVMVAALYSQFFLEIMQYSFLGNSMTNMGLKRLFNRNRLYE
jgi:hypothetical protein